MGSPSTYQQRSKVKDKGSKVVKRKWTRKEDNALVATLSELRNDGWIRDNGIFRSGYATILEEQLRSRLPGSDLKASPNIESRLKIFKRQYDAINEIKDAEGIEWDAEQHIVICEDDEIWEEWVQDHPHARGLRNTPIPYYDDLLYIFGNRGKRIRVENNTNKSRVSVSEEENNGALTLMEGERLDDNDLENCQIYDIDSDERDFDQQGNNIVETVHGADGSNDHGTYRSTTSRLGRGSGHNLLRYSGEDPVRADGPSEANILLDAIDRIEKQRDGSAPARMASKRCSCNSNTSSGLSEVLKLVGTCLQTCEKQSSFLVDVLGRQAALDKAAAEKRERLNGELMKLPNLNLQARLRAASIIITDPAKLDLFYSLPSNERREWVSMVLSGLV